MKRAFPLMTVLCGCNGDVFIDDFAPSADQMQVPADGSAVTLRFDGDNWYVRGLFLEKSEQHFEEIRGNIYNADGTQLYFDVPFHFSDLGLAKYVVSYPQFTLTLERTGGKELRISPSAWATSTNTAKWSCFSNPHPATGWTVSSIRWIPGTWSKTVREQIEW